MPTVKKNTAEDRRVISILVDNQRGVLARVSSLFNRRGFNIDSLTVSTTPPSAASPSPPTATRMPSPSCCCRPTVWKSPARSLNWTPTTACSGNCCC